MKIIFTYIALFAFTFLNAQTQVCEEEIVTFEAQQFRGMITWEVSSDNNNWSAVFSGTENTFEYAFSSPGTFFVRGVITEDDCDPIFTDTQELLVNPLPEFPSFITADTLLLDTLSIGIDVETIGSGGVFTIISGQNGLLEGDFNPFNRNFTGELGERYLIEYRDENSCGFRADTIAISFCSDTLRAIAGEDLLKKPGTQVLLSPTLLTPYDQGTWSILSGTTGSFESTPSSQQYFNGLSLNAYQLLWTVDNGCGTFYDTLAVSFSSCPSDSITFELGGVSYTYGLIPGDFNNGAKCWFDRNLGAERVAEALNDDQSYGFYYQWGRLHDGHQVRNSPSTNTLSPNDNPGTDRFIRITNEQPYDWRSPQNNTLWQAPNYVNNPCPDGWRVPTRQEWENESDTWSPQNRIGAFNSPLKLSTAGLRGQGGSITGLGTSGNYWTQTPANPSAFYLSFGQFSVGIFGDVRAKGMPVRCIKK